MPVVSYVLKRPYTVASVLLLVCILVVSLGFITGIICGSSGGLEIHMGSNYKTVCDDFYSLDDDGDD